MNSPISACRCYPTSTIYPTQYPTISYSTISNRNTCDTSLHVQGESQNPKLKKKPPIQISFYPLIVEDQYNGLICSFYMSKIG